MSDLFEKDRSAEREQFRQEYYDQQQALTKQKSKKTLTWIIAAVVVGILLLWSASSYNGLVGKREEVNKYWSQVENQMQRRADLIPNLVSTVKGITKQELEVFSRVADARSKLLSPTASPEERVRANEQISQFRVQVLSLAEQYPELRSSENFNRLMDELAGTENRISVARRDYIQSVQNYNVTTSQFPTVMMARLFGFKPEENYFQAAEGAKEAPKVEF